MKKYLVEFIGTYFLVLTIGLAAGLEHAGALVPLAVGAVLIGLIYAGGHISAAHYNPAVTLAMWIRGTCASSDVAGYVVGQLAGSVLAALTVAYFSEGATLSAASRELGPTLLAEILFTFAMCWVILNTATASGTEGNEFYGLAIGSIVTAGIFAVGPISGAVFNPAVAVGLCLMGLSSWALIWAYLVAQTAAAVIAAVTFKWLVQDFSR